MLIQHSVTTSPAAAPASATYALAPWGLMALRVIVGVVFIAHGYQKLFTYGVSGVGQGFAQMGIPLPEISAIVVSLVEFLGGIALVAGLFTRYAAILLAITMAVAVFGVHLSAGFFAPKGYEFPLTLLAANVALALAGPGAASVEGALRKS